MNRTYVSVDLKHIVSGTICFSPNIADLKYISITLIYFTFSSRVSIALFGLSDIASSIVVAPRVVREFRFNCKGKQP